MNQKKRRHAQGAYQDTQEAMQAVVAGPVGAARGEANQAHSPPPPRSGPIGAATLRLRVGGTDRSRSMGHPTTAVHARMPEGAGPHGQPHIGSNAGQAQGRLEGAPTPDPLDYSAGRGNGVAETSAVLGQQG